MLNYKFWNNQNSSYKYYYLWPRYYIKELYEKDENDRLREENKNKIDIYDIPIALITEQYLDYIAKNGGGVPGLKQMLDTLNGPSEVNLMMAEMLYDQVKDLAFMHSKQ